MWGYNLNGGWGRAAKRHLSLEGVSQPKSTLHFSFQKVCKPLILYVLLSKLKEEDGQ